MQNPPITPPSLIQIPPKHRTALNRLKCQHLRILTLHKVTPLGILPTPINSNLRKLCTAVLAVRLQDTKKGRISLRLVSRFDAPVKVGTVLLRLLILHYLHGFDLVAGQEALELSGAVLQARGDCVVPWHEGGGACADFACNGWPALAVCHERAFEIGLSIRRLDWLSGVRTWGV